MGQTMRHFSSWLLLLGIAVSFSAFLNGEDLYYKVKNALAEVNEYRYKNTYSMQIAGVDNTDTLLDEMSKLRGNLSLDNLLVKINQEDMYHTAEVLINREEELPYPFLYGNCHFEEGKRQAIIGKGLEHDCVTNSYDNKRYIRLDDVDYEVIGIVGSKNSDLLDGKLILSYCLDTFSTYFNEQGAFLYGSDKENIHLDIMDFYEKNTLKWDIFLDKEETAYIEVGGSNEDEKFYWLLCIFSMVNCVVLSEFWIIRRKQEIVVRKLWGYSNCKLFFILYREMIFVAFLAVSVVWILQFSIVLFIGADIGIGFSPGKFIYSILFILVAALLIVLVPIYKISQYKPCERLEG